MLGYSKEWMKLKALQAQVNEDIDKYVKLVSSYGYYAE